MDALAPDDIEWCLVCDAHAARGTLRRVFEDSHTFVTRRGPPVRVCRDCAEDLHNTPAAPRVHDRDTVWWFVEDDGP